jgi:hypothetical protein
MKNVMVSAVLVVLSSVLLVSLTVFGQSVPGLINYQGRLMDADDKPVTGTRSMHFSVLDSGTVGQGSVLWGETYTVTVQGGLYNVLLGSVAPIGPSVFNGPNRWLEVKVAGEALAPRQRLTSVPYALAYDLRYLYSNPDMDADGHKSLLFGGDDCNDGDPSIYPGAPEVPGSGIDHSCDGFPFGPADMCGAYEACGYNTGGGCVQDMQGWFEYNLTPVSNWVACTELAASCAEIDTCINTFMAELSVTLCTNLDACGYISSASCQGQISNYWDGGFEELLEPFACVQDAATCGHDALQRCLTNEEFQYMKFYFAFFNSNDQFAFDTSVHILFGNTSAGVSIRGPRGDVQALYHREGWEWKNQSSNWFNSLSDLAAAYPSGQYELLQGATVIDVFQVPAFYGSDFPHGIYGVSPGNGISIDQDPLTVQWQYSDGAAASKTSLEIHNETRGVSTNIDDLAPDTNSSTISIPSGVQYGDSLRLQIGDSTAEEYFHTILNQFFLRTFKSYYDSMHSWTGP